MQHHSVTRIMIVGILLATASLPVLGAEKDLTAIANAELGKLEGLVELSGPEVMGLTSTEELETIKAGKPINLYLVRLDHLKNFDPQSDYASLLYDTGMVVAPVYSGERVAFAMTLTQTRGVWQASEFGGAFGTVMATAAKAGSAPEASGWREQMVVHVAALNLYFVGHRSEEGLFLTPIFDNESLEFRAGVPLPIKQVVDAILPLAREHDGLPR